MTHNIPGNIVSCQTGMAVLKVGVCAQRHTHTDSKAVCFSASLHSITANRHLACVCSAALVNQQHKNCKGGANERENRLAPKRQTVAHSAHSIISANSNTDTQKTQPLALKCRAGKLPCCVHMHHCRTCLSTVTSRKELYSSCTPSPKQDS